MTEMIERVASAIMDAENWIGGQYFIDWKKAARLAIEAMREPTEAMIDAVDGPWSDDDRPAFLREYGIAIDAALKDPS